MTPLKWRVRTVSAVGALTPNYMSTFQRLLAVFIDGRCGK